MSLGISKVAAIKGSTGFVVYGNDNNTKEHGLYNILKNADLCSSLISISSGAKVVLPKDLLVKCAITASNSVCIDDGYVKSLRHGLYRRGIFRSNTVENIILAHAGLTTGFIGPLGENSKWNTNSHGLHFKPYSLQLTTLDKELLLDGTLQAVVVELLKHWASDINVRLLLDSMYGDLNSDLEYTLYPNEDLNIVDILRSINVFLNVEDTSKAIDNGDINSNEFKMSIMLSRSAGRESAEFVDEIKKILGDL